MQLSKHYVQQTGFIQQQKITLHSSVNILLLKRQAACFALQIVLIIYL